MPPVRKLRVGGAIGSVAARAQFAVQVASMRAPAGAVAAPRRMPTPRWSRRARREILVAVPARRRGAVAAARQLGAGAAGGLDHAAVADVGAAQVRQARALAVGRSAR